MEERWVYDTFYRVQEALCAPYAAHAPVSKANLQENRALCAILTLALQLAFFCWY